MVTTSCKGLIQPMLALYVPQFPGHADLHVCCSRPHLSTCTCHDTHTCCLHTFHQPPLLFLLPSLSKQAHAHARTRAHTHTHTLHMHTCAAASTARSCLPLAASAAARAARAAARVTTRPYPRCWPLACVSVSTAALPVGGSSACLPLPPADGMRRARACMGSSRVRLVLLAPAASMSFRAEVAAHLHARVCAAQCLRPPCSAMNLPLCFLRMTHTPQGGPRMEWRCRRWCMCSLLGVQASNLLRAAEACACQQRDGACQQRDGARASGPLAAPATPHIYRGAACRARVPQQGCCVRP